MKRACGSKGALVVVDRLVGQRSDRRARWETKREFRELPSPLMPPKGGDVVAGLPAGT